MRLTLQSASPERGGVTAGDGGVILLARRVLRSHFAYHAFLLECLAIVSRLSLFLRQEKRDGLRQIPFLFREGRDRR